MSEHPPATASGLVAAAKVRMQYLSPDAVAAELKTGDVVLIDLYEPAKRATTRTNPNAIHAPRGMLKFHADPASSYHRPKFDSNQRTILHCASGERSALAADTPR